MYIHSTFKLHILMYDMISGIYLLLCTISNATVRMELAGGGEGIKRRRETKVRGGFKKLR